MRLLSALDNLGEVVLRGEGPDRSDAGHAGVVDSEDTGA